MKIGIPKETAEGERRVALVPDAVSRLVSSGFEALVERDAGAAAYFRDDGYAEAGARLVESVYGEADLVAKVQKPSAEEIAALREGTVLIGYLQPLTDEETTKRLGGR